MPFDLPRSPRSLRFTGEVRALAPERALAQPRPRLPSNGIDTPTKMKTPAGEAMRRSLPSLGTRDDDDDDRETLCMDRDALDIALLPDARFAKPQSVVIENAPASVLPVPGFRSREDVLRQEQAALHAPRQAPDGPFPLGVWLIASVLLAIVSFFAAPIAKDTIHAALHASAAQR